MRLEATFLLVRVDDRLLHGQVVYGWGQMISPRKYLIADDEVAADEWECEAFRSAAPPDVTVEVISLSAFAEAWVSLPDPSGTVVLLRGLPGLERLVKARFKVAAGVNLGGLHARPGTREILPYLHLTKDDEQLLRELLHNGYPLYAQDLPTSPRHGSKKLLGLIGT
ncbi:MAG: PTS sugar transporter subunit IIB [Candidatus Eisenbacteria sp.]|nr:PTS sugar transporter subunit IIB [Candidatus Eisenbacteria bacterium]